MRSIFALVLVTLKALHPYLIVYNARIKLNFFFSQNQRVLSTKLYSLNTL